MVFLTACAASGPQRAPQTAGAQNTPPVASEPRSGRGNPPFYDVLGKRYHVLPTSAGYHQRGVASWYGRDFHGLATSSVETYDMHAMTAAHTTLPIPTWVEVTNLSNGKRVVVKVNDRGPFVDDRLIDLSYAAATALDMVQSGTTRVEVRAIGAPAAPPQATTAAAQGAPAAMMGMPRPASSSVPPPATVSAERMFVQVGAFAERDNATRLVERLRASGSSIVRFW
jgi:rare lipoprotein A